MRPLELLVIVANLPYLCWLCFSDTPPPLALRLTPILTISLLVCHLGFEDRRWHMIPAYCAALLMPLVAEQLGPGLCRTLCALAVVGLLSLSAVACSVFPVFDFPVLTGLFPVGTTSLRLVDENRPEPAPAAKRELMIQIWYPAEKLPGSKYARYTDPGLTTRSTTHLALVKTRSLLDAPLLKGQARFPVLLFSPSVSGKRSHNTYQVEQLASHGYVVVGIDHTHCVGLVVFPDGRRVRGPGQFLDFSSEQAYRGSIARLEADLLIRVADASFVLGKLVEWNSSDPSGRFTGRLDVQRAGIFGHSFGGAVAAEACRRDSRFIAGMNIDGWMFGESRVAGVKQPFFLMLDNTPRPSVADLNNPDPARRRYFNRVKEGFEEFYGSLNRYGGYLLSAKGLEHMKYSDFGLYSPISRYGAGGSLDCRRAHKIVNHYTLAFFNKYLYGKAGSIQKLSSRDYPEIQYESHLPTV